MRLRLGRGLQGFLLLPDVQTSPYRPEAVHVDAEVSGLGFGLVDTLMINRYLPPSQIAVQSVAGSVLYAGVHAEARRQVPRGQRMSRSGVLRRHDAGVSGVR